MDEASQEPSYWAEQELRDRSADDDMRSSLANGPHASRFPKVSLVDATGEGYVLLGAEIDRPLGPVFPFASAAKRRVLGRLKEVAGQLTANGLAWEAAVFSASLIPPGRGAYLKERPEARIARYDVALLAKTADVDAARGLLETFVMQSARALLSVSRAPVYTLIGENVRRIGAVKHSNGGIYLVNYFVAADRVQNLAVWEHTAGWFQAETGLDNSELICPVEQSNAHYTIVNHCRWASMWDVLPGLLVKPSFRSFVLESFERNRTAAMPILYRLA